MPRGEAYFQQRAVKPPQEKERKIINLVNSTKLSISFRKIELLN